MKKTNEDWVREIENGIKVSIKITHEQKRDIDYIYLYAISHAIESLSVEDPDKIQEIEEYIDEMVERDWECDPKSKERYKFHYASAYIFSHVAAEKLDEMEADRILDYVCDNVNIFG